MRQHGREVVLSDLPPTPDQLHRLASIGVSSAAERQKLRSMAKYKRAHFFVDEVDMPLDHEDQVEVGFVRHRMAGRVGIRAATHQSPKIWSLKFFDTYFVEQEPGKWVGERTLYSFEWNRLRVEMARRSIKLISDYEESVEHGIDDLIDNFSVPEDMASMWHVRSQMEQVTADDCEELIEEAARYYSQLRQPA